MIEKKIRVILDTNFLLIPGQFKVDIFSEISRILSVPYQIYIFKATIDELDKIASSNRRDKNNAKVALELIKQKNLKSLPNSFTGEDSYIDRIIVENVSACDIVCTQDRDLKRLLRQKYKRLSIISLRSKRYLILG